MENETALKVVFQALHAKIAKDVNPDSAIDELFSKNIISDKDCSDLYRVTDIKSRCRQFLLLLRKSSHPETFTHLRDALRDEYPSIVDEIDQQLPLQSTQVQRQRTMDRSQSTDGKFSISSIWFSLVLP